MSLNTNASDTRSGLRLHLNENTAGCSPAVIAALQSLTRQDVAIYPDYDARDRGRAPAGSASMPDRWCSPTAWTRASSRSRSWRCATGRRRHRSKPSSSCPAFDMYAACSDAAGGRVVEVPLGAGFAFPLESVLAAITPRTRVVWLTNPNNPTGQVDPAARPSRASRAAAPDAVVIVDEAYADFAGDTLIGRELLARSPNIVVGRTFAKAYGLAGLRIGALVGDPATLAPIRRVIPPYSVNTCAAAGAAGGARATPRTSTGTWIRSPESEALLYDAFDRLGFRTGGARRTSCSRGSASDCGADRAEPRRARRARARPIARSGLRRAASESPPAWSITRARSSPRWRRSCEARQRSSGARRRRRLRCALVPRRRGPLRRQHRHPLPRSHAGAVRAPRRVRPEGARRRATSTSISTTRWRISASRSARRCQRARQPQGHQPRRLLPDADGRDARRRGHRSGRANRTRSSICA